MSIIVMSVVLCYRFLDVDFTLLSDRCFLCLKLNLFELISCLRCLFSRVINRGCGNLSGVGFSELLPTHIYHMNSLTLKQGSTSKRGGVVELIIVLWFCLLVSSRSRIWMSIFKLIGMWGCSIWVYITCSTKFFVIEAVDTALQSSLPLLLLIFLYLSTESFLAGCSFSWLTSWFDSHETEWIVSGGCAGKMFWFCVVITISAIKGYCLIEVFALYLLEHSLLLVEDSRALRLRYPEFFRLDVQIAASV